VTIYSTYVFISGFISADDTADEHAEYEYISYSFIGTLHFSLFLRRIYHEHKVILQFNRNHVPESTRLGLNVPDDLRPVSCFLCMSRINQPFFSADLSFSALLRSRCFYSGTV